MDGPGQDREAIPQGVGIQELVLPVLRAIEGFGEHGFVEEGRDVVAQHLVPRDGKEVVEALLSEHQMDGLEELLRSHLGVPLAGQAEVDEVLSRQVLAELGDDLGGQEGRHAGWVTPSTVGGVLGGGAVFMGFRQARV